MTDRIARIQEKLARLSRLDKRSALVESVARGKYYGKGVPLSEIEEFEAAHQVKLPDEFREFLLYIGQGSGTEYGTYLLKQMVAGHADWADALSEGSLSAPFDFGNKDAEELIAKKREDPKKT